MHIRHRLAGDPRWRPHWPSPGSPSDRPTGVPADGHHVRQGDTIVVGSTSNTDPFTVVAAPGRHGDESHVDRQCDASPRRRPSWARLASVSR